MEVTAVQPRGGWRALLRPAVLDRFEQAVIVLLWSAMAWRMSHAFSPFAMLALLSETAIVFFILIRRPAKHLSTDHGEWMLAFAATAAPLLITARTGPVEALIPVAVFLWVIGNFVNIAAKLVLRRSFGIAPANRGLKLTGPYRVVRHPMYGGYLLSHIGIFMLMPSWLNLAVYVVAWTAMIRRLGAEERLLGLDPQYREYMGEVRYRLIPGVY
jgi:protein-S-isoprenylcysteine O-methyltransferase Ste14